MEELAADRRKDNKRFALQGILYIREYHYMSPGPEGGVEWEEESYPAPRDPLPASPSDWLPGSWQGTREEFRWDEGAAPKPKFCYQALCGTCLAGCRELATIAEHVEASLCSCLQNASVSSSTAK